RALTSSKGTDCASFLQGVIRPRFRYRRRYSGSWSGSTGVTTPTWRQRTRSARAAGGLAMTVEQLQLFPAFRALPVYDDGDQQADEMGSGRHGKYVRVRECVTLSDVASALGDPGLVPLGARRVPRDGGHVVVAYFGERS